MKNYITRQGLKIYLKLFFTLLILYPTIYNTCSAQSPGQATPYTTLVQQADLAMATKDYPTALLLYGKAKNAKPELTYASGKIMEINSALDAIPDSRAQLFESIIVKAENLYKQKDYQQAKTEYQKALVIDPSAQFPKDRLSQISSVFTDPDDLAYFNDAMAGGNLALSAADFDKAILFYETALAVKPDSKAVKDKISNTKKQQSQYKLQAEQAEKIIIVADKLLLSEKRTEARSEYQKALNITPGNAYAVNKIKEIDDYLNNKKALQDSYDKLIEQADQFYINRDFPSAHQKYQEALKVKPEARYPKEMLEKTKSGQSQLQSDQERYDAALTSAENLFAEANFEAALAGYKSASAIKPAETYPKTKINEITKLITERTTRKEAYDIAVKNGDQAFEEKKYDLALGHYRNALSLLPDEKYPEQKIAEITMLVVQQRSLDENYKKSISEADKQFEQNKLDDAIASYTRALGFKPGESYPQQKIAEAQAKLSTSKSNKEIYANAIASGNRLFSEYKYTEALDAYELARSVNTFEGYPISKISEIKFLLEKYDKEIEKGDKAISSGNFDLAIKSFQDASEIKPSEKYPRDKIAEAKAAIANQLSINEKYATAINTGDQLFAGKEYDRAIVAYTEAMGLKRNEKHPQDQLSKINKILSELRSTDEAYNQSVSEGDNYFSLQNYQGALTSYKRASSLKPSETYPAVQADKINKLIENQKKLEGDYVAITTSADMFLNAKKYSEAIAGYQKALTLKPNDKYPSDKIAEAEAQLANLKQQQENYEKAILDGDKYFLQKDFSNSMASFKSANLIKPEEVYPKQKIIALQAILDKDKAESQQYNESIVLADKYLSEQKYRESLESYHRASTIRPDEKYPSGQIAKINLMLADQKKLDEEYQKHITEGASLLNAGKYVEARSQYTRASELKPAEKLPKEIISKIDGIVSDLENKELNYSRHISEGDNALKEKRYPEALASYTSASAVKPAESYPKTQIERIKNLVTEKKQQDDNYNTLIVSADILFDRKKYAEAILDYRSALSLKPGEKYPIEKINDAEKQIADLKALEDAYSKAVADGDKKLADKKYPDALAAFQKANTAKPTESYPQQKIEEIQAIINNTKAANERYQEAIDLADKFYSGNKFREALEPYQRASTMKPDEKYPRDQIARVNQILAEQKKLDDDYQNLFSQAENQLQLKKYDEARSLFVKATELKPSENLPKNKIAEIDRLLAGLKLKEENYSRALNSGAEQYAAKNLTAALKSYEEALSIKPEEKYPQERITAIKAELKVIDDMYSRAIILADTKLEAKNLMEALNAYQNALEIKPGEEYPKTKIAEINSALANQKQEQEKLYNSYIAEGDRLFSAKDYSGAKSAFTKAAGIKPAETYPKQRITEITKLMDALELAFKAEYTKALGEADKLYNSKVYDQAIDAYENASKINPADTYPGMQISKIRKYMADHAIQDLYSQLFVIGEGNEKKFTFSAIEPRLRKNNYILLKARSTGKTNPKVYLNYGKDAQKNGGIVLRSLDKATISDYLIRISVQDKWYREDNNWISLFVETGEIEISKLQIAAGDE